MKTSQSRIPRLFVLALAIALLAALSAASIATAGSRSVEKVSDSSSHGGQVVKADQAGYCEAPHDARDTEVEPAAEPEAEVSGEVEKAPEPRFCERPLDDDVGDVEPRG